MAKPRQLHIYEAGFREFNCVREMWRNLLGLRIQFLEHARNPNGLTWIGHVFPMPTERLPRMLRYEAGVRWKMGGGG